MVTIDGYLIDAALTEGHKYSATLTKYPTESGSPVTDHVVKEPKVITIEGVVSDTPMGNALIARQSVQSTPDTTLEFLPSDEALARLEAIYEAEEPIVVETSLKRYENMVLVDLDVPVDEETGDALRFTAVFEQIKIITNQRTTIRVASPNNARKVKRSKTVKVHPLVRQVAKLFTDKDRALIWNPEKGRYEYGDSFDSSSGKQIGRAYQPNGVPASAADVEEGSKAHNQNLSQQFVDPDSDASYDYRRSEWMNKDGTPVTQQGMSSTRSPWYK